MYLTLFIAINAFGAEDDCGSSAIDSNMAEIKSLKKNLDFLARDPNLELIEAVRDGSIKRATKWLDEKNANPDAIVERKDGNAVKTVLFIAIENNDVDMVKLLLSRGASYNSQKETIFMDGNTPLVVAMRHYIWTKGAENTEADLDHDKKREEILDVIISGRFQSTSKENKGNDKEKLVDYDQSEKAKSAYYQKFGWPTGNRTMVELCFDNDSYHCLDKLYNYASPNPYEHRSKYVVRPARFLNKEFLELYLEKNQTKISARDIENAKADVIQYSPAGEKKDAVLKLLGDFKVSEKASN